jgi:hypothetical protein
LPDGQILPRSLNFGRLRNARILCLNLTVSLPWASMTNSSLYRSCELSCECPSIPSGVNSHRPPQPLNIPRFFLFRAVSQFGWTQCPHPWPAHPAHQLTASIRTNGAVHVCVHQTLSCTRVNQKKAAAPVQGKKPSASSGAALLEWEVSGRKLKQQGIWRSRSPETNVAARGIKGEIGFDMAAVCCSFSKIVRLSMFYRSRQM